MAAPERRHKGLSAVDDGRRTAHIGWAKSINTVRQDAGQDHWQKSGHWRSIAGAYRESDFRYRRKVFQWHRLGPCHAGETALAVHFRLHAASRDRPRAPGPWSRFRGHALL